MVLVRMVSGGLFQFIGVGLTIWGTVRTWREFSPEVGILAPLSAWVRQIERTVETQAKARDQGIWPRALAVSGYGRSRVTPHGTSAADH